MISSGLSLMLALLLCAGLAVRSQTFQGLLSQVLCSPLKAHRAAHRTAAHLAVAFSSPWATATAKMVMSSTTNTTPSKRTFNSSTLASARVMDTGESAVTCWVSLRRPRINSTHARTSSLLVHCTHRQSTVVISQPRTVLGRTINLDGSLDGPTAQRLRLMHQRRLLRVQPMP